MLHAFIDESGQRSHSAKSSCHFLMSAAVVRDSNLNKIPVRLDRLRVELGRETGDYLTWKKIRTHPERLHVAKTLGSLNWLRAVTVVTCKRHLDPGRLNETQMYLFQLRFLLERLSWLAQSHGEVLTYTLAHIRGFKMEDLREYEHRLRSGQSTIRWDHLDPRGGGIDQPQRLQELQLADLLVSASAPAFEPDRFGNVETAYFQQVQRRFYRKQGGGALGYGLKIHPWAEGTKAAYPWAAAL